MKDLDYNKNKGVKMKDKAYQVKASIGYYGSEKTETFWLSEVVDLESELSDSEIDQILADYAHEWAMQQLESWYEAV